MNAGSTVVAGAVLVLIAVGCGSDDSTSGSTATATPTAPQSSSLPLSTSTVPDSTPPTSPTSVPPAPEWDGPEYELSLPDFVPGPVTVVPCCASDPAQPRDSYRMAWTDTEGAAPGLLALTVTVDSPEGIADGDNATAAIDDIGDGEAWLLWANDGLEAADHRFLEVAWQRSTGDAWRFASNGLSPERLVEVVKGAQPGSEVPVVIDDSSLQLTAVAGPSGAGVVWSQDSTVAEQPVSISVRNDGGAFQGVVLGEEIRPVVIAGAVGYVATLANGQVEAVWDAGDGRWATITIAPSLAARSDEIIDSIVASGSVVPSSEQRFDISVEVPSGSVEASPQDLFIVHEDGDLYWHPGILGASPQAPVRLADFGDPRDPVLEGPGPNGVDHVAGVVDGTVIYGDCCEPISGNLLAATGPDAERLVLGAGYTPNFNADKRLLATANDYAVVVIDVAAGVGEGITMNQDVANYRNIADATWATNDRLIVLFWDETGYQLLPIDVEPIRPGVPVSIEMEFDPEALGSVRFAGTDQNGHLALTDPGPESTAIRFFDPVSLVEIDELERRFDTGVTSIRLDPTGTALLYVDDGTLVYQSTSGESELGPGYIAAWFVR